MTANSKSICIYFILKNIHQIEDNAATEMKEAFKIAIEWNLRTEWLKESNSVQVDDQVKGKIFVFEEFEGDIFNSFVESHRNRVIGPKCLMTCFLHKIPIPHTPYPVYCMAMDGLRISVSNVPIEDKRKIEKLVGFMGGNFSNDLTTATTHLVVDAILSEKYFKACEEGIPVIKSDWIEDVWRKNTVAYVKATDENIINKYKCPTFYNLRVTASNLNEHDKDNLKRIIDENGGTYTKEMTKANHVLIIPVNRGDKFKYAERWKIKCINPQWIDCCLQKGFAVRYNDYLIHPEGKKCSTPVKTGRMMTSLMDTNDTEISVIPSDAARTVVGESAMIDTQSANHSIDKNLASNIFKTPVKSAPRNESPARSIENAVAYKKILENINLTEVKKCESLLDGCKVFLMGFHPNEEEKLRRVLNYGGAMRFTELNESVTHVIVGKPNKNDLQSIKNFPVKPYVVTLEWLLISIKKGCLEKESNCSYLLENNEKDTPQTSKGLQQPSPLSKKGLQMLNPVKSIPAEPHPLVTVDQNLIDIYSNLRNPGSNDVEHQATNSNSGANRENLSKNQSGQSSLNEKLFADLKFSIVGHTANSTEDIKRTIVDFGGVVVAAGSREVVDYTVVPVTSFSAHIANHEVVTSIWIEECLNENMVLPPKYYHRQITVPDIPEGNPFGDCVITFSSYSVCEKQFLENIASFLGAKCQDVLSKKQNQERVVARTTHLICAAPQGVKYNAAKKWYLPIVNEKWLLECFSSHQMLPVDAYLLCEYKGAQNTIASSMPKSEVLTEKGPSSNTRRGSDALDAITNKNNNVPDTNNFDKLLAAPSTSYQMPAAKSDRTAREFTSIKMSTETLNAKRVNATPTLTEAVSRSTDRKTDQNYRTVAAKGTKDLPSGLLVKINDEASSRVKRKINSQNSSLDVVRNDNPKRKLLRLDDGNVSSSYEEVGWQDTLTDISLIHNIDTPPRPDSRVPTGDGEVEKITSNDANRSDFANDKNGTRNQLAAGEVKNQLTENRRDRTSSLFRNCKKRWNMMISLSNTEKKQQCESIITSLGGQVLPAYQPDCSETDRVSHLIIDDLKKTEKLLCSIASGSWVLHSSYLSQCQKSKKFVNEEEFEWGNPLSSNSSIKESKDYSSIAKSAYRWRKAIQYGGQSKRPFVGMRINLVSSSTDDSVQSLMRVVKSGGGIILPSNDILKATHVLVKSVKNLDHVPVNLKLLAERKIHCLPAVYLSDFLMNDPAPKPETCYFDVYKRFF